MLIREEAQQYRKHVSDAEHCNAISRISDRLSHDFATILVNNRFRYGTSQKALNLYLKFLWRLAKIGSPPHCPIDGTVLTAAGIIGSWTKSDSMTEYVDWIRSIRKKAGSRSLSEWEYDIWLKAVSPQ